MSTTLFLHSSVYGLSKKICERMADRLRQQGLTAQVAALTDIGVNPAAFGAIVIGASIKHGKHNPTVLEYLRRHKDLLDSRPSALFSVSLIARKPGRNTPQTNPYLKALLAQSPWKPKLTGVFAGELDYSRYGPVDKYMMRLVMWINRGPTDFNTKVQFTNWDEVDRFAQRVIDLVRSAPSAAARPAAALVSSPIPSGAV